MILPFSSSLDSSATILQGPDVLQLYSPTSGCIHKTTDFQGQYGSLISLFDEEQKVTWTCVDGGACKFNLVLSKKPSQR